MDKAKPKNQKVNWHIKKCSYDSNLDCYVCIFNDFIYKAHLKNHKEYAANFKAIAAKFVWKKRVNSYVARDTNQDTNVKSKSNACILKVNGTVVGRHMKNISALQFAINGMTGWIHNLCWSIYDFTLLSTN